MKFTARTFTAVRSSRHDRAARCIILLIAGILSIRAFRYAVAQERKRKKSGRIGSKYRATLVFARSDNFNESRYLSIRAGISARTYALLKRSPGFLLSSSASSSPFSLSFVGCRARRTPLVHEHRDELVPLGLTCPFVRDRHPSPFPSIPLGPGDDSPRDSSLKGRRGILRFGASACRNLGSPCDWA